MTPVAAATLAVAFLQTHLALDVTVHYTPARVQGVAVMTLENRAREPHRVVPLLLNRLMTIAAVRDAAGRPLPVSADVVVFHDDPMRQVLEARVTLPAPLPPNDRVTIAVEFGGPLTGYTETGMLYVRDRIDPAFTILRADALAFPTPGVPSLAANGLAPRGDFGFEARVTVPASQVVAAGGALLNRSTDGDRVTYVYRGASVPFLNIAIAPYSVVERRGIRIHALPGDGARAEEVARATERALALLERWFGPLPNPPAVTIAEIPQGFGSQASATAGMLLDAAAFRDARQLSQLYHELSHYWNVVDRDAPSPRWNEGLATYLQYRMAAELDGVADRTGPLDRARSRLCAAVRTDGRLASVPFARYGSERLTDFSYRLGFLMFAALEERMGRDRLDAGLRAFVERYRREGATTRQLIDTLRAESAVDLDAFFEQWMFTTRWIPSVCSN